MARYHCLVLASLLASRAAAKTCGLEEVYSNSRWTFEKLGECSELDLGYGAGGKQHHLGTNDVHLLADAIKSPEVTLQALSLADDSIGDAGAIELAAALMTNQHLTSLHLGKNQIGDVGALALAQVLSPEQAPNSKLQVLNLVDNPVSDGGAAALAESLKFNKVLTSLDLGESKVGDEGSAALAEALQSNTALTSLYVSAGSEEVASALLDGLTCNSRGEGVTCKATLGSFVQRSEKLINSAVAKQANLEVRKHQLTEEAKQRAAARSGASNSLPPPHPPPTPPATPPATNPPATTTPPAANHSPTPPPPQSPPHINHNVVPPPATPLHAPDGKPRPHPPATPLHAPEGSGAAAVASDGSGTKPPGKEHEKEKEDKTALLKWVNEAKLSLAEHLPMLEHLGVKHVEGRVSALAPLRRLTFTELSAELSKASLPCGEHCAANKAGLYAALQAYKRDDV